MSIYRRFRRIGHVAVLVALAECPLVGAGAQSSFTPLLVLTPSQTTIAVGAAASFSAINESSNPLGNVQWTVSPPIAELQETGDGVLVSAKEPGRVVITATVGSQTASASAIILPSDGAGAGSAPVVWSVLPIPGFETVQVLPAWPNGSSVTYYSIEGRRSEHALVRAFNESGQQLWMEQIAASATPASFEHKLPPPGEIYLNEALVSDHSYFILGGKDNNFLGNHSADPSTQGLPINGQATIISIEGDCNGGLMLLERGRFRDSLVDIGIDGRELWRYSSQGRLQKRWAANLGNNVGIVETLSHPVSSALVLLNEATGELRSKIPIPLSSSTIDGFPCSAAHPGVYKSLRPSVAGPVMTNSDRNIYLQVETFIESETMQGCKGKQYSFDNHIALLRVTPDLQVEWSTLQSLHADGLGSFQPQNRIFASETIPDGFDGVLAAWTMVYAKAGEPVRSEAHLTRIGSNGQQDFTLPLGFWTADRTSPFSAEGAERVLGEGNVLYASNGPLLVRFDPQTGMLDWGRHPPTGSVKMIIFSTSGGGVMISNAGRMGLFDATGNLAFLAWTVAIPNSDDIGLVQTDPFDHTPLPPLAVRDVHPTWYGGFIGVEDGPPLGKGSLVRFIN